MDCFQNTLKENILKQKCIKHPCISCDMINMDPLSPQHRICSFCIEQQRIPAKYILSVANILNLETSAKFPIFPLEETFLKLFEQNFNLESIGEKVDEFFFDLKQKIEKSINRMYDSESQRIKYLITQLKQTQQQLGNLLSIQEIQGILYSQDPNHLHDFIVKQSSTQFLSRIEGIKAQYGEIDFLANQISFERPAQRQQQIIALIDTLQFSMGNNKRTMIYPFLHNQRQWDMSKVDCFHSGKACYFQENLIIKRINNNTQYKISSTNTYQKQCYFNQLLDNHKKYIIKLEINHGESWVPCFQFGLLKSQDKNDKMVSESTGINYSENYQNHTTKIVKGQQLHTGNKNFCLGKKNLEIRIDIQNKLWRMSSFPQYENVAELDDPSKFYMNEQYYFSVDNGSLSSDITIFGINEVPYFDNSM